MVRISRNRITMEEGRIGRAILKDYGETLVGGAGGVETGATETLDVESGNVFHLVLTADCTFNFNNPSPVGTACTFTLILRQDAVGGRSVIWPSTVVWVAGDEPTLTTEKNRYDILTFTTTDAGSRWLGFVTAKNYVEKIEVWGWGRNNVGQVGDNTVIHRSSPVQVGVLNTWSTVSVGFYHTAALKTDGTLWGWGGNNHGQLGINSTASTSSPAQVGALTTWARVSAGGMRFSAGVKPEQTFAIKTDGTLWSWGSNIYGQLGQNDIASRSSPAVVGALTDWAKINAGGVHALAIKTDGTLWAWGINSFGGLGDTSIVSRSSPVQVGALTTWSQVSGGPYHSLAVKTDGTLWSWGDNGYGQLGSNSTASRSSPVQVGALTDWSLVSAGGSNITAEDFSLAIKTDGTLWAWGRNSIGQLGLNNTVQTSSPAQVGTSTWSDVSGGNAHTVGVQANGTLWSWGRNNNYGQIAQNDAVSRSSPTQVGTGTNWKDASAGRYFATAVRYTSSAGTAAAESLYSADAVNFDGTNDYLTRGAGLTGAADSKLVTFSVWVKAAVDGSTLDFLTSSSAVGGGTPTFVAGQTSNSFGVSARNAALAVILNVRSTSNSIEVADGWVHCLASFDMSDTAKRFMYLNDVSDLTTITTYTDDSIEFTGADWVVGALSSAPSTRRWNGDMADLMFWPGTYLDLSVEANRRLFIS